jgi:hypothetical protein
MGLMASCSFNRVETKDRITAPENNIPPLEGKWVIEKYVEGAYKKVDKEVVESFIGKEVLFHKKAVVLGEDYCIEPSFKIKNVKSLDYLLYKYKVDPEYLGINEKEVQIVTVLNDNQFFYEFIKEKDDKVIVYTDDAFFFLKKIVNKVSEEEINRYINVEKNMLRMSNVVEDDTLRSGILLGIKSTDYDEENQIEEWNYKTLWIRSYNKTIESIYEMENLFVPRKKGFWLVSVDRENNNGRINDKIKAISKVKVNEKASFNDEDMNILFKNDDVEMKSFYSTLLPSTLNSILFIGNDYVSLETTDLKEKSKKTLEVYPIDNIEKGNPIKISDLIGEDGNRVFEEGAQSVITTDLKNIDSYNVSGKEENFGLTRRNGHWIMKGRINYRETGEERYKDFNIKAIPPREVVNYDELNISWNAIKLKVPEATDAFSSPNDDIILIVTNSQIYIYPMYEGAIGEEPLQKIKLKPKEKIVMAEWAIGRYAKLWEEEFLKNEVNDVNY